MRAANPSKITGAPKDRPGTHVAAKTSSAPAKHHLDQRADKIAGEDVGADDDLLTTRQVAGWLGVSTQWVDIGRSKNYGPPFKRLTARSIRYLRGDVLKWLKTRTHASTAEYASPATAA
jgi:predicted DNA-binding transcriptional regulator AlpA